MNDRGELGTSSPGSYELWREPPTGALAQQLQKWLAFRVHEEALALPVGDVESVERVSSINRIPHAPPALRGLTNLRGRVVPVIDLGRRLGGDDLRLAAATRLIVLHSGSKLAALLVDAVDDIVAVDLLAVEEPPSEVSQDAPHLLGVHRGGAAPLQLLVAQRLLDLGGGRPR